MIGKLRRLLAIGGILGSAFALISVTPALAGAPGTGGGPTPDRILGSGSDTTQLLMQGLDGLYIISEGCAKFTTTTVPLDFSCIAPDPAGTIQSENYEHDQVHEADFLGSSTGVKQLCTQGQAGTATIDFARSSRGPRASDCTGLHFVAYARDGISLEANDDTTTNSGINSMANPDPLCATLGFCLTQAQVQGIYRTCTITTWDQVGGQALPIQIYTPQAGSGTRSTFDQFVGGDSSVCITINGQPASHYSLPENQNTGIAAADKQTAIFPFSYAIFQTEINPTSGYQLSAIDGVVANSTNIGSGSFPYSRYVYNVICSTTAAGSCGAAPGHRATQATVNYVGEEGWLCKPSATENAAWSGAGVPAVDSRAALPHSVSPHYQVDWQVLVNRKISDLGFAPLALGTIGGGDLKSDHCRLSTT